MTPQLRFPEFNDEWQVRKLGDITQINPRVGSLPDDFIYIDLDSVKRGTLLKQNRISKIGSPSRAQRLLSRDDIIYQTVRPYQKNNFYFDKAGDYVASTGYAQIRAREGYYPRFVYTLLHTSTFVNKVLVRSTGTNYPAINSNDLAKVKVHTPSKPEQEKIADFLTAVDERIRLGEQKLVSLEQYKRGVMQQIFSQKIRFKDENGNPYPDWEEKKLGELEDEGFIKLGRGNVISKIDIKKYPGEYPIYSSSVKNEGLFGRYGKYMFDEELITWSVDGGGDFFYRSSQKFSITNVSGWLRVLDDTINCKFLATQLQMLHERQKFDYTSKAHPSVIRNIYTLKIPAIEEQQKIANFLTTLDEKITTEKSKLTTAKQFKKALLQRMFV